MTESPTRSVKSPASNVSGKSAPEATPALQGATGAPLPSAMRKQMEESFEASFKDVRVSVSGAASERGARAFAQGNQVTVAPKEWQPGSRATSRLIAHELAHVQQQRAGRVAGKGGAVNADGRLEAEADQAASRVLAGQDAGVSGGQGGASAASAPVQLTKERRNAHVGVGNFSTGQGRESGVSAPVQSAYDDDETALKKRMDAIPKGPTPLKPLDKEFKPMTFPSAATQQTVDAEYFGSRDKLAAKAARQRKPRSQEAARVVLKDFERPKAPSAASRATEKFRKRDELSRGAPQDPELDDHVRQRAAHVGAVTTDSRASSLTRPHEESEFNGSKMGDLRDMQRSSQLQSGEFKDKIMALAQKQNLGEDAASVPPLKGDQRSAQKTDIDYKGNASNMKDFNRSALYFDTIAEARAAAENVRENAKAQGQPMQDAHYKDNLASPAGDMNLSLPMRNGQRGEAQFHVRELAKYKKEVGHKLYEVDRSFKRDENKKIVDPKDQEFSDRIAGLQQSHIAQRGARQGKAVGDGGTWDEGELDKMKEDPVYQEALTRLHEKEQAAAGAGAGAALDESEVYSVGGTRSIKKKIRAAEASFKPKPKPKPPPG